MRIYTRQNIPPRLCEGCGNLYERKRKETPSAFSRRRFCGYSCARARKPFSWERFDSLTNKSSNSDCWLWIGSTNNTGYGVIWKDGKHQKAHRLSYERHKGPIPDELQLMHSCDNPPCINPDHLTPGTFSQNIKDMWRKGRANIERGEKHGSAILTEKQVRDIYADKRIQEEIAKQYGVSRTAITAIKNGQTWHHLRLRDS